MTIRQVLTDGVFLTYFTHLQRGSSLNRKIARRLSDYNKPTYFFHLAIGSLDQ